MYPVHSIIIVLEEGKLKDIKIESFEDLCEEYSRPLKRVQTKERIHNLPKTLSYINGCPIEKLETDKDDMEKFNARIFFSWDGTDRNKKPLISTHDRFMEFKSNNLSSLFRSILPDILEWKNESNANSEKKIEVM